MTQRGDGIGLEITRTVFRGIRLDHDQPGQVANAAEVPISRFDDNSAVFDTLVRLRGQLSMSRLPTRVAWFPARSTMQRTDVTGLTGPELNSLRHHLASSAEITSTMLVDVAARRWMLTLRWDHHEAWRVQELVERAGFADVAVEPSPVALERVLSRTTRLVRRDTSEDRSWCALYSDSAPLAAASIDAQSRESPGLSVSEEELGLHHLDEMLPEAQLTDEVNGLSKSAFPGPTHPAELNIQLQLLGDPYPPFPAHDLRAPQRVAVALGAAAGAAGLAGRVRPVDVLIATDQAGESATRPWAVERIAERRRRNETKEPSRWQQQRRRIFRR